jgi:hypothetical protein
MKLHEEFRVVKDIDAVWAFFEQPEEVARCVPGVEDVRVLDGDNVQVRATQSIGPLSATFDAKVTVLERIPKELIRFQATGKSVRGAVGNVRTMNEVHLLAADGSTSVRVEGDVVLAGALGSVGQKIVARQASKVTAQFAANLELALSGKPLSVSTNPLRATSLASAVSNADESAEAAARPAASRQHADPWSRVAALMSTISAALAVIALVRSRRP